MCMYLSTEQYGSCSNDYGGGRHDRSNSSDGGNDGGSNTNTQPITTVKDVWKQNMGQDRAE